MVSETTGDESRLEKLHAQRREDSFSNKLAVGPGDIIEVTVPGVPELNKFKVRVSEDSTVSLPLAGVVPVGGMTEEELREALQKRLERPVKNPNVEVFVDQYQSRDVAVVGMVQKPGLYSITSRADTVLSMINRAGGITVQASSRVLFIPASQSSNWGALAKGLTTGVKGTPGTVEALNTDLGASERQLARTELAATPDRVAPEPGATSSSVDSSANQNNLLSLVRAADPIEIDLANAAREVELDVPVRPGDTILVPAAGEVMVDGWVQNPGAFHIVPGMTALGAVTAAGGALFSQTAAVLRTSSDGSRRSIEIDLAKVKAGQQPDVPVQEGDVVVVKRSALAAIPYAFSELFKKFGTGMFLPIP